jgi:hypothetical protein
MAVLSPQAADENPERIRLTHRLGVVPSAQEQIDYFPFSPLVTIAKRVASSYSSLTRALGNLAEPCMILRVVITIAVLIALVSCRRRHQGKNVSYPAVHKY